MSTAMPRPDCPPHYWRPVPATATFTADSSDAPLRDPAPGTAVTVCLHPGGAHVAQHTRSDRTGYEWPEGWHLRTITRDHADIADTHAIHDGDCRILTVRVAPDGQVYGYTGPHGEFRHIAAAVPTAVRIVRDRCQG